MKYLAIEAFQLFLIEQREFERRLRVKELTDRFLDAYSGYLKTHRKFSGLRSLAYAKKIRELDPSFTFKLRGGI